MWSGVLGAILVLSYAGSTITATSQGSLLTLREVRKQLTAATPAEHSDEPSTPNYRSMLEAATGSALERMTTLVLGAILIPTTIGIALRLYYGKNPGLAGEALLSLVTLASVTALAIGLLAHAARIVLERLRAAPKDTSTAERSASPAGVPALQFGTLAELVGNSAGPAAQIFVKALAIICLTLTPLII
jgi:Na+/H+-translocating membrane pyrophosphatase